ncbi:spore protein Tlp [Lysinibacillus sp. 2017]|uniref:spore protein Tlp n=1 Tax=unclassified Lysinibacillus TaxID=2636778 RepID=UPI000D527A58|nr:MULTISPECIES: spore protein Tlp [unclassified Lysinibacillus]AWE07965.1 spore protein Tlp [Lysinibacillus sp. 2017]TGN29999.1 spore protein Tlp [Lysinibacillus sp. S2017]
MKNKKQQKSNNALSVGKMIENTKENIEEAEISMEFAIPEELENLEEKNARRRHSINIMEDQIKDEAAFQARKDRFK